MSGGLQRPEALSEATGLIERALDLLRHRVGDRPDAARHLEKALKALRSEPKGIPPRELSSANDG